MIYTIINIIIFFAEYNLLRYNTTNLLKPIAVKMQSEINLKIKYVTKIK